MTEELEVWQHVHTGEQYAVRLHDGELFEAAGPLYSADRGAVAAGNFDGDPEVTDDLRAHGADYVLVWKGKR